MKYIYIKNYKIIYSKYKYDERNIFRKLLLKIFSTLIMKLLFKFIIE